MNDDSESDDADYNLLESYDDDDDQPKEKAILLLERGMSKIKTRYAL